MPTTSSAPELLRARGPSPTGWLALACAALACIAFAAPGLREQTWFEALAFAVLVSAVAASSTRFAGGLLPGAALDLRCCAAALIGLCSASASVALLGTVGALGLPALAAASAALCGLATRVSGERWLSAGAQRIAERPVRHFVVAALAVFGCGFALFAVNLARYTVKDSDSMWYHLPMVAEWLRSGSIAPIDSIPLIARAYPGFRQAVLTFLTAPIGNEHLALLAGFELPFFFVALYAAVRRAGATPEVAASVACYGATTPIVLRAAGTQGTDVLLAILLLCAFLFTRELFERRGAGAGVVAGLALGALAAVKFSGPIYAVLVLGCLCAERLLRGRAQWPGVRAWAALAAGALVIAGPWYGRNLVMYGNPLYPAQVLWFDGPLGRDFFEPITLGWNVRPLIEHWPEFLMSHGVLGPLLLATPFALAIALLAGRRSWRESFALLVLPPACFVAFLHQPYNVPFYSPFYNMRYLIAWFAIGLAACVLTFRSRWLVKLFLAGAVTQVVSATDRRWEMGAALVLAWLVLELALRTRVPARAAPLLSRRPAAAFVVLLACTILLIDVRGRLQYSPDYGYRDSPSDSGWGELSRFVHGAIAGRTIGVHGSNACFPFYGDRFTNRVEYLDGTPATADVLGWIQARDIEFLVCLAPVVDRSGAKEFAFGESLGTRLLRERPGLFGLVRESRGSQVLRVRR